MLHLLITVVEQRHVVPTGCLVLGTIPHLCAACAWNILSAPLPLKWRNRVDERLWGFYQKYVLFFFETVSGVRLRLYGADVARILSSPSERVLYISNHQCTVDWVVADSLAARQGHVGLIRYLLKNTLVYLPLYGWYFYNHGCVYVRRGRDFKQEIALRQLNWLRLLPDPFWLVIFPEGTRYQPSKKRQRQATDEFLSARGLPKLEHVLAPRHRGLHMALGALRDGLDAIYDVSIVYGAQRGEDGRQLDAPSMFDFVCGRRDAELHVHVDRIEPDQVPVDETELADWLHKRWQLKDKRLHTLYEEGQLPDEHEPVPLDIGQTLPAAAVYSAAICQVFQCTEMCGEIGRFATSIVPALVYPKSVGKYYALTWLAGAMLGILWVKARRGV